MQNFPCSMELWELIAKNFNFHQFESFLTEKETAILRLISEEF